MYTDTAGQHCPSQGSAGRAADLFGISFGFLCIWNDGRGGWTSCMGSCPYFYDKPNLLGSGRRDFVDFCWLAHCWKSDYNSCDQYSIYADVAVTFAKIETGMSTLARSILSFGNTDEVFAVAMQQRGRIPSQYLAGLILTPYFGWAVGTLLGGCLHWNFTGFCAECA